MICVMIAWFCATDRDGDIVLVCPSNVCEGIIIIIARIHEQPFSLPPTMDAALALPSRAHLPSDTTWYCYHTVSFFALLHPKNTFYTLA